MALLAVCTVLALLAQALANPLTLYKNHGPEDTCPDGGQCSTGQTCCKTGVDMSYGCCPQLNAVCCDDMKHCCPSGYTCDDNYCEKDGSSHPLLKLARRPEPLVLDIPCGAGSCPDGDTCCDDNGCCPKANAVCCADGVHCCPSGYTCGATKCIGDGSSHPLLKLARRPEPLVLDTPCGAGTCPGGTTCCEGLFCCPSGYTCNPGDNSCTKDASLLARALVLDIPCAGGTCPDGNTCCTLSSKPCCPTLNGVCCNDAEGHCCPPGTYCDPSAKYCLRSGSKHPLLELATPMEKATFRV